MTQNLALVIHSLAGGGAERVVSRLANHWAEAGKRVTLITLDDASRDAYRLSDKINRVGLGLMSESRSAWGAVLSNLKRLLRLRRAIKSSRASTVISFTDKMNVITLLACLGTKIEVLICERTVPDRHDIGWCWSWWRRRLYRYCRGLVVQTEAVRNWSRPVVRGKPVYVIPNAAPTDFAAEEATPETSPEKLRIVALGRLSREKGFDLLLSAFSIIAEKHPRWSVEVYGEGAERAPLERLREELGLTGRVQFPGWVDDPQTELSRADLFVLPSRFEGFPNALLEAMSCGVAGISFDCECGPKEIIRHERDGLLVPPENVEALAAALDRLMSDDSLRQRLGNRAREVTERFSPELFFKRWEAVLNGVSEADFAALNNSAENAEL